MADGTVLALENDNSLSAVILARTLMETVAVQVELTRIIRNAGTAIPLAEIDEKIMHVVTARKNETQNLRFLNSLRMIDRLDAAVTGYRALYDHLGEYANPNRRGVLDMFSDFADTEQTSFGRYLDAAQSEGKNVEEDTLQAVKLSLYALTHHLQIHMSKMEDFKQACDAFAELEADS